ncbi:MAG: DUF1835 domain-containing protein [Candidatus Marinimicrobia bacterium]|nr:DUF1835 domain-containing protein [Candidatus Neomarinimicrobiota bacterium]MBL7022463.1 DUF1835 domain-containing protein [Candidatus Neomarinimicrobiota bacterium]MBL7108682.1 DUF1835 domain-containing protein [Candidatus Neomarinimicrobiota bacterium]
MKKQYHILNGDSLKEQFPDGIQGELIVARECLVDGNVKGKDLNDFFHTRAEFISSNYNGYNEQDYFEKIVPEFQKMQNIPDNSDVNLWFEDDLFCQVNFWFVVHLLCKSIKNTTVFLIRPKVHSQYSFGGLNKSELISIYENRLELTELDKLANLWESYQIGDTTKLVDSARKLESKYPFILPAVEAHIERIPTMGNIGRPTESLVAIMKELETDEFGAVFREFSKRESIYGFGDLQVKRLFDEIKNNR